jgi:hypothetical protein
MKFIKSWRLSLIIIFLVFASSTYNYSNAGSNIETKITQLHEQLSKGRKAVYLGHLYIWEKGVIYKIGKHGHRSIMRGVDQKIMELVNPFARLDIDSIQNICYKDSKSASDNISILARELLTHRSVVQVKALLLPKGKLEESELDKFGTDCMMNLKTMLVNKGILDRQFIIPKKPNKFEIKVVSDLAESLLVEVIYLDPLVH